MDPLALRTLLEGIRGGSTTVAEAEAALRDLPFADLGFANVDHHRALRSGFPEVVLGQGKTLEQLRAIVREIDRQGQTVLVTRVSEAAGRALASEIDGVVHDPIARIAHKRAAADPLPTQGHVCVVSAGTSDMPVAEEAAVTAEVMGNPVDRIYDVGVAGVHRLLHHRIRISEAAVLIVVAGMEGALASVVGGLVARPIIAVPTSVGYGASFGGVAALLGMLTSCASGVTVVNIDNGFGAAYAATLINRPVAADPGRKTP